MLGWRWRHPREPLRRIAARLHAVLVEGLKDPAFRSSLDSDGSEIVFNSPA